MNVNPDTAYCLRHGWVEISGQIEVIPGKYFPLCALCGAEDK